MVVSLKANKKRILAVLLLAVVVAGACFFLRGGEEPAQAEIPGATEEQRTAYLQSFGWEVEPQASETREVMIPAEFNDVYTTYNEMQKAQGFDLKPYAGEICTQYKYKITNYPGEEEVYATLLVYGDLVIGGDVACSKVDGFMHGFAGDSARFGEDSGWAESSSGSASQEEELAEQQPTPAPESEGSQEQTAAEGAAGEPVPEEAWPTD